MLRYDESTTHDGPFVNTMRAGHNGLLTCAET